MPWRQRASPRNKRSLDEGGFFSLVASIGGRRMSNVEARFVPSLPSPAGETIGFPGRDRSAGGAAAGVKRRRLVTAGLVAGDLIAGGLSVIAAVVLITVAGL